MTGSISMPWSPWPRLSSCFLVERKTRFSRAVWIAESWHFPIQVDLDCPSIRARTQVLICTLNAVVQRDLTMRVGFCRLDIGVGSWRERSRIERVVVIWINLSLAVSSRVSK